MGGVAASSSSDGNNIATTTATVTAGVGAGASTDRGNITTTTSSISSSSSSNSSGGGGSAPLSSTHEVSLLPTLRRLTFLELKTTYFWETVSRRYRTTPTTTTSTCPIFAAKPV